jgi:CheY-like chemotaxis protein
MFRIQNRDQLRKDAMKKPPGAEANIAIVPVVSVSATEEDHVALQRILSDPNLSVQAKLKCAIQPTVSTEAAAPLLQDGRIPVVFSEHDQWRNVLAQISLLPHPPLVIVTSRLADDRLWAEALNLGAYDVLSKPFVATEVTRTVILAWHHWQIQTAQPRQRAVGL